jgi:hypothetical protein
MSDKKRGCLPFFGCFAKPKTVKTIKKEIPRTDPPSLPPTRTPDVIEDRINNLEKQFIVRTSVDKEKLIIASDYDKYITKFNCPICFKYLNRILKFECCGNYICLYCVEDYKTTHVKYEMYIKCPFCRFDRDIHVSDVNTSNPEKIYIDTPVEANNRKLIN